MTIHRLEKLQEGDVVLDALPDNLAASMQVRDAWFDRIPRGGAGEEFFVVDLQRWTPGQKIRVAFLGANKELHADIGEASKEITDACNLDLDFGLNESTGEYRSWSEEDQEHAAEIRVSFDQGGYWSLVGTDSVDPNIGLPHFTSGGRPHQRSLNLGGFAIKRPQNWRGVVRHEFLHALAFKHSHQNMRGPCEDQLRWEDDLGYEPTTDEDGRFVKDSAGRRPGIYTYLAGFPNEWTREKVDHNLRTKEDPDTVAGPFDPGSVMLYRFQSFFYRSENSPCAPVGDGLSLSEGDKRGLRLLYPSVSAELEGFVAHRTTLLEAMRGAHIEEGVTEPGAEIPGSYIAAHATRALSDSLDQLRH